MKPVIANLAWGWGAALATLLVFGAAGACVGPCPPLEPFLSGQYTIVGLEFPKPLPDHEWIIEAATGAALSVDRDAREAIIVYTRGDTTYEVHFDLEE